MGIVLLITLTLSVAWGIFTTWLEEVLEAEHFTVIARAGQDWDRFTECRRW